MQYLSKEEALSVLKKLNETGTVDLDYIHAHMKLKKLAKAYL